uniref:Bestrophin homolog n=1 Tax=Panagrellus redivivus TaxID=6233 RepID=A0A7E4ZV66_PANRE
MREASTAGVFTFLRLLFRWKGSVWKIVGYELSFWLWAYLTLSISYRFFMKGRVIGTVFEQFVIYCNTYISTVQQSLSFVLGFYVSIVAGRWWNIFMRLPWPDTTCLMSTTFIRSRGEKHKREDRLLRRTIVRYLVLAFVMVLRNISERIRKRFPDLSYLKNSLVTVDELELIQKVERTEKTCVYWLPLMWIMKIYKQCYEEYHTLDEIHFVTLNQELRKQRDCLNDLLSYDWICTPLVYTQVVNIATAFYMTILLVSSQFLALTPEEAARYKVEGNISFQVDYVIPVFAVFQFIFYVGWLKVAQVTLNPFGTDDDDFEVDFLIERDLKIGYAMVDELFEVSPQLVETHVVQLPHTKASAKRMRKANPMIGSVANLNVNRREAQIVPPPPVVEPREKKPIFNRLVKLMPRLDPDDKQLPLLDKLPPTSQSVPTVDAEQATKRGSEVVMAHTQTASNLEDIKKATSANIDVKAAGDTLKSPAPANTSPVPTALLAPVAQSPNRATPPANANIANKSREKTKEKSKEAIKSKEGVKDKEEKKEAPPQKATPPMPAANKEAKPSTPRAEVSQPVEVTATAGPPQNIVFGAGVKNKRSEVEQNQDGSAKRQRTKVNDTQAQTRKERTTDEKPTESPVAAPAAAQEGSKRKSPGVAAASTPPAPTTEKAKPGDKVPDITEVTQDTRPIGSVRPITQT